MVMPAAASAATPAVSRRDLSCGPPSSYLNTAPPALLVPSWLPNGTAAGARRGSVCAAAAGKGSKAKKVKYPRGGAKPREKPEDESEADAGETKGAEPSGAAPSEEGVEAKPSSDSGRLMVTASEPLDGKVQVQIQVPGKTTQGIYNKIMAELAKTCPPVPGARMSKGGKATKVDPAVVIRLVGKNRVTGFVVKEVVNSTLATFVKERGLNAEKEGRTLQSADELASMFVPGEPFAFDAEVALLDSAPTA